MAKQRSMYICSECGYESGKWYGKCPGCGEWNTMNEETPAVKSTGTKCSSGGYASRPLKRLSEITEDVERRISTGIHEFDRVLGGGIVEGSLVLLGGDPGIGKSTILLQACQHLGQHHTILYVSGEESANQIKLRANRLGVTTDSLYILAETDVGSIAETIRSEKPDIVIIDSIQTMVYDQVTSSAGSVTQVRECTNIFMHTAKTYGIPIFVVGHVNKDGAIAGPRMMEHMVDVVLYFEGERNYQFRILRGIKNRFGSTNESGLFTMTSSGLSELENPSQLLLAERAADQAGSAVAAVLDGMRPMLGEIQALTAHSVFAVPRRTASGMDYNRLIILLAVLEKRLGVPLGSQDVYINVVGGLRLTETAADLPVALAVYSSLRDISMDSRTVVMGEVGLTGDIRRVPQALRRVKEAAKMGFNAFILPKGNLEDIETDKFPDCHFLGVATLREAIEKAFRR